MQSHDSLESFFSQVDIGSFYMIVSIRHRESSDSCPFFAGHDFLWNSNAIFELNCQLRP